MWLQVKATVKIKYNHYEQDYETINGRLKPQNFFSLLDVLEDARLHLSTTHKGLFGGKMFRLTPRADYQCYQGLLK